VADRCGADLQPETYAARVNLEHIRGVTADPPFQALGDVLLAAHADRVDRGGRQDRARLALFAEIEALEPLVAMNKAGRSCSPRSRSTRTLRDGQGLSGGLAVTDSPASLGTEMLAFAAAQGDKSPLRGRKLSPETCSPWPRSSSSNWPTTPPIRPRPDGEDRRVLQRPGRPACGQRAGARPTGARCGGCLARPRLPTRPPRSTRPWPGPSRKWPPASRRSPGPAPNARRLRSAGGPDPDRARSHPAMAFAQRQPATGGDGAIRTDC
jgi:hypothetical protein